MAAREERDEDSFEQMILSDDHLLDFEEQSAGVGRDRRVLFVQFLPHS
jgi:hypothetical protein